MFEHSYIILGFRPKRDISIKKLMINFKGKSYASQLEEKVSKDRNVLLIDSSGSKKGEEVKNTNLMLRNRVKGLVGHPLNSSTLFHYSSKEIVYSYNKVNNLYPLLTKTEYLLRSLFRSIHSLISKPIYLIRHDKVIIRLFIFLSPKVDKYLDTSTLSTASISSLANKTNPKKKATQLIKNFLKFKSLRPKTIEVLNTQIQSRILALKKYHFFSTLSKEEIKNKNLGLIEPFITDYPYTSLASTFNKKLEKLSIIFSKILKKKVEFEIVKAQLPFQDSNVLAQIIGYNANNYKFRRMLKVLIPRAVIKNPSKELTLPSPYPMLAAFNLNSNVKAQNSPWKGWGAKDLNILFSQPSSYLPPFYFSKVFINNYLSLSSHSAVTSDKIRGDSTSAEKNKLGKNLPFASGAIANGSLNSNINTLPLISYLSGMNIKLAGRIMTESMRPRFTVQSHQEGSLARVKVHFTEKSRFTGKNKRGAFSFTVTISHVLN